MKALFSLLFLLLGGFAFCRQAFESDPLKAQFVTADISRFWEAFDTSNSGRGNPFRSYLENGSAGLKAFIPHRVESSANLKKTVRKRKADYEKIRESSYKV